METTLRPIRSNVEEALIKNVSTLKETDRRNRDRLALFYLLPPVFEMMLLIVEELFITCWTTAIHILTLVANKVGYDLRKM